MSKQTVPVTKHADPVKQDQWLCADWHRHAAFDFLAPELVNKISHFDAWPHIEAYAQIFQQAPLGFIEQDSEQLKDCGGYERYIEKHNAIPTRPHNIHDFMNALSWHHFPISKMALHHKQSEAYRQQQQSPHNRRSPLQNACTLFDECGVILVSEQSDFIECIRHHNWTELFINNRTALEEQSRIITLGHALLEKSLKPYIGMCGNLIHIAANPQMSIKHIDELLAQIIQHELTNTGQLHPFPILGYPGWHPQNTSISFYRNEDYFRSLKL